ncbi:hypothetical protein Tco_0255738 [Tanacetum coccineum]
MPGDEIESVSGFEAVETKDDDTQSQHKEELSKSKETVADNVLDGLADMANSHNVEINASTEKPSLSDPLGHLQTAISSLFVRVEKDLFILIDSGSTSTKVSLEGEKMSTQENKDSDTTNHAPAQEEQQPNEIQTKQASADEEIANAQGEQSSEQAPLTAEQAPLVTTALVVQSSKEKVLEEKPIEDEPLVKRLRLLVLNPNIPSPTPLNSFKPQGINHQFIFRKKMTLEETKAQMEEIKRLEFLKDEKEKSEKRLKVLIPEELEA